MKAELIPESSQQSAGEEGGGAAAAEASNEPKESAAEASKESEDGNEGEEVAKKEGEKGSSAGIKVEYLPLDLSSFQSTIDCVRAFKEKNLPLHILINNAAICAVPYSECTSLAQSALGMMVKKSEGGGGRVKLGVAHPLSKFITPAIAARKLDLMLHCG